DREAVNVCESPEARVRMGRVGQVLAVTLHGRERGRARLAREQTLDPVVREIESAELFDRRRLFGRGRFAHAGERRREQTVEHTERGEDWRALPAVHLGEESMPLFPGRYHAEILNRREPCLGLRQY